MMLCVQVARCLISLIFSFVLDVDSELYSTDDEVNAARARRLKLCLGPWFSLLVVGMLLTLGVT